MSDAARDFVEQAVGGEWNFIHLNPDDQLLTMMLLKFNQWKYTK
jgi:hypothetical protein